MPRADCSVVPTCSTGAGGVIVEYDGEGHRTSSRQYERDETRLEDFALEGFRVVRIRKGTLFGRPDVAAARIERALRDAGWRR
jgi:very-short-patch-repair endonuclease